MIRIKDDSVEVRKHQLSRLNTLLSFLPEVNRRVLQELMTFFHIVSLNASVNQTSDDDIAAVFGPILIWKKGILFNGNAL